MSLQNRLDLQGVLQRARENAQGAQVKVIELGGILQALPQQDTIESRVSSVACSLFQTQVTKENSADIAVLARSVCLWKYFSSLDWRTRSNVRIALAQVEGKSSWMITAWECFKSFIWTITLNWTSKKALQDMLEKEYTRSIVNDIFKAQEKAIQFFTDPSISLRGKLWFMKYCIKAGISSNRKGTESMIGDIEVTFAKTLFTIAAAAIPKSTLEKYILKVDAPSAPLWFPLVCQELGLGREAPTK